MNTHQLVIRCDTTNGYYKVGWASELPLGRFKHFELLLETENQAVLTPKNPDYSVYQDASNQVSELNQALILKETQEKKAVGWYFVPLNLNDTTVKILPDEFGCFNISASKTRYRLSKNSSEVWAVITENEILQVEARYPVQKLTQLKYQIWKNYKLDKLKQHGGIIKQGKLVVCFSGLWFVENTIL